MKRTIIALALALAFGVANASSTHECQGNSCNGGGTVTNTNTNNNDVRTQEGRKALGADTNTKQMTGGTWTPRHLRSKK